MKPLKNYIAINALFFLVLLGIGSSAYAAPTVGTVTNLSGHLLSKNVDGTVKILSQKSAVTQGDILVTEKDTYAQIKFIDNSEITLRPNTQFKIENFSYEKENPSSDGVVFELIKGGLRSITGLLGKRNHERFSLKTPTATIGIRGTIFIAQYVPDESSPAVAAYGRASLAALELADLSPQATMTDAPRLIAPIQVLPLKKVQPQRLALNAPPSVPALAPGLYVHVIDGMINLSNKGGAQNFSAGQFGFTPSFIQPPVIVPSNPGLHFSPPPAFSVTSSSVLSSPLKGNKLESVDCEVR